MYVRKVLNSYGRSMKSFLSFFLSSYFFYEITSKRFEKPFNDIIDALFIKPQIRFDIIIFKSTTSDIIDRIGGQLHGKILRTSGNLKISQSAVIFTQSLGELLNSTELTSNFPQSLRVLIHSSEKYSIKNLSIPKPTFDRGHIAHYSYFVTENLKEIQLWTLEWFTENSKNIN